MPQLDVTTYYSQLFWLGIFVILLLLISVRFMLPHMASIHRKRWQKIEGTREQALGLQHQAHEIQNSFEQHLTQVRTQAQKKILQASEEVRASHEQAKMDIDIRHKDQVRSFEMKLSAQQKAFEADIPSLAQSLTTDIVQKMLCETVPFLAIEQSVQDVMAQKRACVL